MHVKTIPGILRSDQSTWFGLSVRSPNGLKCRTPDRSSIRTCGCWFAVRLDNRAFREPDGKLTKAKAGATSAREGQPTKQSRVPCREFCRGDEQSSLQPRTAAAVARKNSERIQRLICLRFASDFPSAFATFSASSASLAASICLVRNRFMTSPSTEPSNMRFNRSRTAPPSAVSRF